MNDEKEILYDKIYKIDEKLTEIQVKILDLEQEKQSLLATRHDFEKKIKDLTPSSRGGTLNDNTSNWNNSNYPWTQNLFKHLKETFKCDSFRPLQLETINATLTRKDCLVVMPTGAGKSICFQLPSIIDQGITLVVSPLISLIEDQIWSLKRYNIRAETLNSNTSKEMINRIHGDMLKKDTNLKILYVTPEKLAKSKRFMNKLEKMYELKLFARLVIDEVHCCSHYGHDFRPDYKFLGVMKRMFPDLPILGLTATATTSVIDDLKKILNLKNVILFKSSFNRPNLFYEVHKKLSNQKDCIHEMANLIQTRFNQQSGIVYCFSQKESEEVSRELNKQGLKTDYYHASLDAAHRSKIHENWLNDKIQIIVATTAFGMGIDKSNVRFVIHHSLSKSLANFYQESGRAGRDGAHACSILFYRFADIFRQSSMVFTEQTGLENLYAMVDYCVDNTKCKRELIGAHFNESLCIKDGLCNEMCDYCVNKATHTIQEYNAIQDARFIVETLNCQPKEKRITANKLVEVVAKKISLSQLDLENLIFKMITNGYLKEDFHFTPYNTICYIITDALADSLDNEVSFSLNVIAINDLKKVRKKAYKEEDVDDEVTILYPNNDQPKKKFKN